MRIKGLKKATMVGLGAAIGAGFALSAVAETPRMGGILNIVVGSKIPSYDGHRETTFGMIHPIRPFYSLLIRINPDNPSSPTDFICDICEGAVPNPTDDGKTYVFKIREGVKFHDGGALNSQDVLATYNKIVFPPKGVPSARKAFFKMVDTITAPDDTTLIFKLKYASAGFIPAVATPFNFIYAGADLDKHGYDWHTKNINGSGAFTFVQHQPGAFVEGKKYANYHHAGKPYLDGYKAIAAPKMATRLQAIRGGRADIEFRGFPPKARDDLVKALGDKVTVQESDWNCALFFTSNHEVKPFDDPRVRRALSLAVDRWSGSKYLSRIAIVKAVGGIVYPSHPLAATQVELEQIAGYGRDIEANRAEARRLLKEAGHENLSFTLLNRGVDQPYKVVGTWLIDQWRKTGMKVKQDVKPTGPFLDSLRKKKDFQVSIDFNCQSVINPVVDISKFLGSAGNNYGSYNDPTLEKMFDAMNREGDPKKVRQMIRAYEKRVLDDEAHMALTLWWYKINPHRSYVKGWKIAPSHYLNQSLDQVWLDK